MEKYRNLAAIALALFLMQAATGALIIAVPLGLDSYASGPFAIGVVAGFYALGFLVGAMAAPRLLAGIGHLRAFAFFATFAAALSLLLFARIDAGSWAIVRFGVGVCVAGLFVAGESWLVTEIPDTRRREALAAYHAGSVVALIVGAAVLAGTDAGGPTAYMIAGGLFAMSLASVVVTQAAPSSQTEPSLASEPLAESLPESLAESLTGPLGPRQLFVLAPAALIAATGAGAICGAVISLSPLYAGPSNPVDPTGAAAGFFAALLIGGLGFQYLAGMLSDRVDRRLVIGVLAATAAAASFALALTPPSAPSALVIILALVWGGGALSVYGVSVAHALDRASPSQRASVMAGLLMMWAAGAAIGPFLAGLVVQAGLGGAGLFVFAGLCLAALSFAMVRRSAARAAVDPDARAPFAVARATSVAATQLDPRIGGHEGTDTNTGAPEAGNLDSGSSEPGDPE